MANTFKLKTKASVGVTTQNVYVVPAATTTTVIGITLANVSGSSINVGIGVTRASTDDVNILRSVPIPQGSSLEVMGGNKLVLEATDTLTAISDVASSLDGVLGLGNTSSLGMSVGVVTATAFVGDGSGIFNLPGATVGIDTNTTNQAQLIPFAVSYGSTTGFGATDGLVFNPSTTRLGIGSDAPAYSLDVAGDINSSTDVKINGTGVLDTALALAIALG